MTIPWIDKGLTDEWVELMEKPENHVGPYAMLSETNVPNGVDPTDPRVLEIQRLIQERNN